MPDRAKVLSRPLPAAAEVTIVTAVVWVAIVAYALANGKGMGLSWDALNHHFYLGWVADGARFDKDFLAAGYQSLQYPYLYWPAYKLAALGAGSGTAAVVMTTLHLLAAPALWLIARAGIPGNTFGPAAFRLLAVALAFVTGSVLSMFTATSNDLLAGIPLLWAVALCLDAMRPEASPRRGLRIAVLSGLLAGASVAFKFSNGPIAILMPLLWIFLPADTTAGRARHAAAGCASAAAGAIAAYGYWGWQLWQHFGNPIYPFADHLFAPVRTWLGWAG